MLTIFLGVFALGYGLFSLYARITGDNSGFKKLPAMQKAFGYIPGLIIHWIFYTIVPIVLGALILICKFCFGIDIF